MSSTTGVSSTYALDAAHSTVEFVVRHLMIAKVRGRFTAVTGTIVLPADSNVPSAVDVSIDTTTIDTREEQRDGHLKSPDFFDAATYPTITFKSTSADGSGDSFKLHGDLTMHGVTKSVALDVTFEGRAKDLYGNDRVGYEAHTKINRSDFDLTWNAALEAGGVAVSDEVKIEINIEGIAQK